VIFEFLRGESIVSVNQYHLLCGVLVFFQVFFRGIQIGPVSLPASVDKSQECEIKACAIKSYGGFLGCFPGGGLQGFCEPIGTCARRVRAPFDFAPFDKLRIYDRTSEIVEGRAGEQETGNGTLREIGEL
jgi:hypothetical protein